MGGICPFNGHKSQLHLPCNSSCPTTARPGASPAHRVAPGWGPTADTRRAVPKSETCVIRGDWCEGRRRACAGLSIWKSITFSCAGNLPDAFHLPIAVAQAERNPSDRSGTRSTKVAGIFRQEPPSRPPALQVSALPGRDAELLRPLCIRMCLEAPCLHQCLDQLGYLALHAALFAHPDRQA